MKYCYLLLLVISTLLPFTNAAQSFQDANGEPKVHQQEKPSTNTTYGPNRSEGVVLPAGDEVEGDYIGQMVFTTDGKRVMVPHRQSDNISVFDFDSQEIIADIPVGDSPTEVAVTDEYAVIPCLGSNEIYILKLEDLSVAAIIPAPAQPAKVRVSQDGALAAVACDEADQAIVIDLMTLEAVTTISNFPCYISKFSLITSGPRNTVYWSDFEFTPDNNFLVLGSESGLRFYEIATGAVGTELGDIVNTGFLGLSADGSKLVAVKTGNPGMAFLIDLATQSVESSIEYDGFFSSAYSSVAVNMDGSRALVPGSSGVAALIRFDEGEVQEVNTTSSPNWVGRSADLQYAISGQYYLTLIDFETGNIEGQLQGRPIQNGVVSPVDDRLVATDPLRYESLDFYTFDNTGFDYLGRQATGSPLEADIPYSAAFTPDGKRLLVANSLSGSISVIDAEAQQLEAIIPLSSTETYFTAITSDGAYALVAKRLENTVDIISLSTLEVVQTLSSGGSKPDQVFILPGDEYAYVINSGGTDAIGVIALDGASSTLETSFACGNTGISWTNYGIRSDFKVSPEGQYGLLATPFDEEVQVIDLNAHEVIASVPVGGFPLQIAVSNETEFGTFAAVTLKNDGAIAIIAPVGPDAAILDTYPCGGNPTRIAFNENTGQFAVCLNNDNAVNYFDLENLSFEGLNVFNNHTPIAVDYARDKEEVLVLRSDEENTPDQLSIFGIELLDLPSTPIHHFAIADEADRIALNLPVTDEVFLVNVDVTGIHSNRISLNAPQVYELSPNPSRGPIQFKWKKESKDPGSSLVNCRIYNSSGQIYAEFEQLPASGFSLSLEELPAGTYWYQVTGEYGLIGSGKLIKQ